MLDLTVRDLELLLHVVRHVGKGCLKRRENALDKLDVCAIEWMRDDLLALDETLERAVQAASAEAAP